MIAVAVGAARGWEDELAEVERHVTPDLYLACNNPGIDMETLDHWCTLHPERLLRKDPDHDRKWPWVRQRREAGMPSEYVTWSHGEEPFTDRIITGWSDGASGLITVGVALHLNASLVICCGIRMDQHPNAYRDEKQWQKGPNYRSGWKRTEDELRGRVVSMSGWTRRLLGAPEWLEVAA